MDQLRPVAAERLGLLLAGGGARCRRRVSELDAEESVLEAVAGGREAAALARVARELLEAQVPAVITRVHALGWRWMVPGDEGYPALLCHLSDPPLGLFVRGLVPPGPVIAVVGARRATAYGRQVARLLGEELGRAGVVVASGMARGVDAAAHAGAAAVGGVTVAVWGSGPDQVYPPEHVDLAEAIATSGALLTEYLPGTPPRRHHFPERNRILAGLAQAVVVVEAGTRSGALITARLALDEGREVLAVPGSILSDLSLGPNALLRLGARPLLTPRDALDAVGVTPPMTAGGGGTGHGWPGRVRLEQGEEVTVDELAERSRMTVPEVLGELLELELAGRVERLSDGRYCRR